MKKIIYLCSIFLILNNCKGQNDTINNDIKQKIEKEMENYNEIPNEKQIRYILNVKLYENKTLDVFINGIKLIKSSDVGGLISLNPYLLKNGKAKIKLRFTREGGKDIDNTFLEEPLKKIEFVSLWEDSKGNPRDLSSIVLSFKKLQSPVKVFEQEWEVTIDKLPYELEGWQNSRNFKAEDSAWVKEKVVAYYQEMWNILNEGNTEVWMKRTDKRRQETIILDYIPKLELLSNYENAIKSITEAKGKILPMEDFKLVISEDGKLVHLERKGNISLPSNYKWNTNPNGYTPLLTNTTGYFIRLHMPRKKDGTWGDFEIIRK